MKKFIICFLFAVAANNLHAQQLTNNGLQINKDYFKKSKNQSNTGFILLSGGVALYGIGSYALEHATDKNATGAFIILGGIGMAVTSIPFFIASLNSKHKGKMELRRNASAIVPGIYKNIYQTSVSLKIGL